MLSAPRGVEGGSPGYQPAAPFKLPLHEWHAIAHPAGHVPASRGCGVLNTPVVGLFTRTFVFKTL